MAKLMGSVIVATEPRAGVYEEIWQAHCDFASYPPMPERGEILIVQRELGGEAIPYRLINRSFRYSRQLMGATEGPLLTVMLIVDEVAGSPS